MATQPMKQIGCPTCTMTIDGQGNATHEPDCVTEQLKKHKDALHRIFGILKEIGVTAVELPVDILTANSMGREGGE